jgi:hypothetical protein
MSKPECQLSNGRCGACGDMFQWLGTRGDRTAKRQNRSRQEGRATKAGSGPWPGQPQTTGPEGIFEAYGGNEKTEKAGGRVNWTPAISCRTAVEPRCVSTACKGNPAGPGMFVRFRCHGLGPAAVAGCRPDARTLPNRRRSPGVGLALKNQKPTAIPVRQYDVFARLAAIALCEAYGRPRPPGWPGMPSRPSLIAAQHPKTGGWRYRPATNGTWSSAGDGGASRRQAAGPSSKAMDGAKVFPVSSDGQAASSLHAGRRSHPTMTAVGLRRQHTTSVP